MSLSFSASLSFSVSHTHSLCLTLSSSHPLTLFVSLNLSFSHMLTLFFVSPALSLSISLSSHPLSFWRWARSRLIGGMEGEVEARGGSGGREIGGRDRGGRDRRESYLIRQLRDRRERSRLETTAVGDQRERSRLESARAGDQRERSRLVGLAKIFIFFLLLNFPGLDSALTQGRLGLDSGLTWLESYRISTVSTESRPSRSKIGALGISVLSRRPPSRRRVD